MPINEQLMQKHRKQSAEANAHAKYFYAQNVKPERLYTVRDKKTGKAIGKMSMTDAVKTYGRTLRLYSLS